MAHLGSQEKLGATQEELSINPTRVMTVLVDHETWYNEETPGSPEEKDNGGEVDQTSQTIEVLSCSKCCQKILHGEPEVRDHYPW